MKLQIKTSKLQEMLGKAVKGASNNKLMPITSLIAIKCENNNLTLTTTDSTNYLYITDSLENEDFYVVVSTDTLTKLVSKMTSESITLEVKEKGLEVKGNGTYTIDIPLDEDGSPIKYPDPLGVHTVEMDSQMVKIQLGTIKKILTSIKPSLATTMETPCYTGYYMSDIVVGTNSYNVAGLDVKVFDTPRLISSDMMNLVDLITDEEVTITTAGNKIVFISNNVIVYGNVMMEVDDYPIDPIKEFLNATDFTGSCKVAKTQMIQLLDRISLFVGAFDERAINLSFTADGISVSSKASNGVEIIPYVEAINIANFDCSVNIDLLLTQLKAYSNDSVDLHYGKSNALKLVDNDMTFIVALLGE